MRIKPPAEILQGRKGEKKVEKLAVHAFISNESGYSLYIISLYWLLFLIIEYYWLLVVISIFNYFPRVMIYSFQRMNYKSMFLSFKSI